MAPYPSLTVPGLPVFLAALHPIGQRLRLTRMGRGKLTESGRPTVMDVRQPGGEDRHDDHHGTHGKAQRRRLMAGASRNAGDGFPARPGIVSRTKPIFAPRFAQRNPPPIMPPMPPVISPHRVVPDPPELPIAALAANEEIVVRIELRLFTRAAAAHG